jgi:hypothetical protein
MSVNSVRNESLGAGEEKHLSANELICGLDQIFRIVNGNAI